MIGYFLIGISGVSVGFLLGIIAVALADAEEGYSDDEWEDEYDNISTPHDNDKCVECSEEVFNENDGMN